MRGRKRGFRMLRNERVYGNFTLSESGRRRSGRGEVGVVELQFAAEVGEVIANSGIG